MVITGATNFNKLPRIGVHNLYRVCVGFFSRTESFEEGFYSWLKEGGSGNKP